MYRFFRYYTSNMFIPLDLSSVSDGQMNTTLLHERQDLWRSRYKCRTLRILSFFFSKNREAQGLFNRECIWKTQT